MPSYVILSGPIQPTTSADTYPVFDATYGLDGLRSVSTNTARNAIPNDRRRVGMIVGVASGSTATYWRLLSSPWTGTDSDWAIFNNGTDIFISGMTFNPANYNLSIGRSDGTGFTQNLGILASDVTITGGTYNKDTGVVTFSSNITNQRTGLYYDGNWSALSAYTAGTVVTYAINSLDYYVISSNVGPIPTPPTGDTANWAPLSGRGVFDVTGFATGYTDNKVTGGTYNGSSIIIGNSDGSSGTISGITTLYAGNGTINGNRLVTQTGTSLTFSGSSASTFNVYQKFQQGAATAANGLGSHAEGANTFATGNYSHAEGFNTNASGLTSHAEGVNTYAIGNYSHAEGSGSYASGLSSHAEGSNTLSQGGNSHSEGDTTKSYGSASHSEGTNAIAYGSASHAEGINTVAGGYFFYLIDFTVHNDNQFSVTGNATSDIVNTTYLFYDNNAAELKNYTVTAVTYDNGLNITDVYLSNGDLFIENRDLQYLVDIYGTGQHAEGIGTHAIGDYSHAEGLQTQAYGSASHTEGQGTVTYGNYSHAEGLGTVTYRDYQHANGQYNTTGNTTSLFVIGNGADDSNRSDLALFDTSLVTFNTPIIIKNPDAFAVTSPVISFDCDATGIDQPVIINFASTKPKGICFYASSNPITVVPEGAAFQMYNNSATTFPGQLFFDSGAHDDAAIIFRTAPTLGTITERMRITSSGDVGFNTSTPVAKLDVRGGVHMGIGSPTAYAGYGHTVEITGSGGTTPLAIIGGSGTVELWSDYSPSTAVMFGAASPGNPVDGNFHFSTFNVSSAWSDRMIIKNNTGYVGIATSSITNTLHVSATTDPVRFEGLTATTGDTNAVTVDGDGVLHKIAFSAISPTLSFTNGLTRAGNEVVLGGGLTGETTLSDNRTITAETYTPLLNIHSDRNAEFYTAAELISARKWFRGTSATTTSLGASSNAFRVDNLLELATGKTYNIYPSFLYPDDYGWDSGHSAIFADLGLGSSNTSGELTYSAGTNLSRTIYTVLAKLDTWPIIDSSNVVKKHKGWYSMYGAQLDAFGASGSSIDRVMYYSAGGIKWLTGTTVTDMMGMYIAPMKIDDVDSKLGDIRRHWYASAITNSWGIYQEGSTEKNFFGGNVGIGATAATNTLHISAATNPIRIQGLTASTTDTNVLTMDGSGIVHTIPMSGISVTAATIYNTDARILGNRVVTQSATTLTFSGDSASTFTIAQKFQQGRYVYANGLYSHAEGLGILLDDTTYVDIANVVYLEFDANSFGTIIVNPLSITTSQMIVGGDYTFITPLPNVCNYFYIDDGVTSLSINTSYYNAPIITGITYNSGLDESTISFSPDLLSRYYNVIGSGVQANGIASHAEGFGTIANGNYQHVSGKFNIADSTSLFIIGNGTDDGNRSNLAKFASTGITLNSPVIFPKVTESERLALSVPTATIVYQTDNREGLYIYKSIGWVQII